MAIRNTRERLMGFTAAHTRARQLKMSHVQGVKAKRPAVHSARVSTRWRLHVQEMKDKAPEIWEKILTSPRSRHPRYIYVLDNATPPSLLPVFARRTSLGSDSVVLRLVLVNASSKSDAGYI